MILVEKREEVIANIQQAVADGRLNAKVEVDDPDLTKEERTALREQYLNERPIGCKPTLAYRTKSLAACGIVSTATHLVNRNTRIVGLEKAKGLKGAIVTSNHFSPIDNTIIRLLAHHTGRRTLPIVACESNLGMPGLFGFLMKYACTIPVSTNPDYLVRAFEPMLNHELKQGHFVLIYPEQEMWFNYRKPRPCKRGAYLYAARANAPILPCFVEIIDKTQLEAPNFVEVSYVLHVLDPIFPDPDKSVRENSVVMCEMDYKAKVKAYEKIYNRKLDYGFETFDIAGWVPQEEQCNAGVNQVLCGVHS